MSTNHEERFVMVVAVDDTDLSDPVVAAAARLARTIRGSEIHLVHAVDRNITEKSPELEAARAIIERHARAASGACERIVGHVAIGTVWREIVQVAANVDADLILVGTHGRKGVARVVLGSVAEAVLRHAGCPVLTVRTKHHAPPEVPEIEPVCPDCLDVQRKTRGATLWCPRHSEHHPRAHLHYAYPPSFGVGSTFIRP